MENNNTILSLNNLKIAEMPFIQLDIENGYDFLDNIGAIIKSIYTDKGVIQLVNNEITMANPEHSIHKVTINYLNISGNIKPELIEQGIELFCHLVKKVSGIIDINVFSRAIIKYQNIADFNDLNHKKSYFLSFMKDDIFDEVAFTAKFKLNDHTSSRIEVMPIKYNDGGHGVKFDTGLVVENVSIDKLYTTLINMAHDMPSAISKVLR